MCTKCFQDDDVQPPKHMGGGQWQYTCTAGHGGSGPHTWSTTVDSSGPSSPKKPTLDALTDDLLEPLMEVFQQEDRWLEYGVVEHRLRQIAPEVFARHVAEAGHHMFGAGATTASKNRISPALRRLRQDGKLVSAIRPSTGAAWQHDGVISFWAKPPAPPAGGTLTWVDYCAVLGRPDGWTDNDRDLKDGPSSP